MCFSFRGKRRWVLHSLTTLLPWACAHDVWLLKSGTFFKQSSPQGWATLVTKMLLKLSEGRILTMWVHEWKNTWSCHKSHLIKILGIPTHLSMKLSSVSSRCFFGERDRLVLKSYFALIWICVSTIHTTGV